MEGSNTMRIVEYNGAQYRVQNNGLVQKLQATKNNGYTWVVLNPKNNYMTCLRVLKLSNI